MTTKPLANWSASTRVTSEAFFRRLCKSDSIADDLAQDTFVIAFRQLAKFKGIGSFEGWLLRIAYRCFLQNYRQQKQLKRFYEFLTQQQSNDADTFMNNPEEKLDLERLRQLMSDPDKENTSWP